MDSTEDDRLEQNGFIKSKMIRKTKMPTAMGFLSIINCQEHNPSKVRED